MPDPKRSMLVRSFTVTQDVWDKVEAEARRRGSNNSQVLRELILTHLPAKGRA